MINLAPLGDVDGNGVPDLAVGAPGDDDGGSDRGAVWILFLHPNGTVRSHQKISDTAGGFTGVLDNLDNFGHSLAPLGDLDGDGVADIAVGAVGDDDGGSGIGAVWLLLLHPNGTVKRHQKISDTEGGFSGRLSNNDRFGSSLASPGDVDGDGIPDLAVGADDIFPFGAVWMLRLNREGKVSQHQRISESQGGFTGVLGFSAFFGTSMTSLGDLDNDGISELAVGVFTEFGTTVGVGALWILYLRPDGTVKMQQGIGSTAGGFTGTLGPREFASSLTSLGDLDGDGVPDLAVGAEGDNGGGIGRGAAWLLFLHRNGTTKFHQKVSDNVGGFTGPLNDGDKFGSSMALVGDINGDGVSDLAVGAEDDDEGALSTGSVWILLMSE